MNYKQASIIKLETNWRRLRAKLEHMWGYKNVWVFLALIKYKFDLQDEHFFLDFLSICVVHIVKKYGYF